MFIGLIINSSNSNIINIFQNSFMKFNANVKFWVFESGCMFFLTRKVRKGLFIKRVMIM